MPHGTLRHREAVSFSASSQHRKALPAKCLQQGPRIACSGSHCVLSDRESGNTVECGDVDCLSRTLLAANCLPACILPGPLSILPGPLSIIAFRSHAAKIQSLHLPSTPLFVLSCTHTKPSVLPLPHPLSPLSRRAMPPSALNKGERCPAGFW